jgi:ubiquinone/menaquinone biosynthesis C-methylase UbiE
MKKSEKRLFFKSFGSKMKTLCTTVLGDYCYNNKMDISGLPNYRKSNRLKSRKSLYIEYGYPKTDIFEDMFNTYQLKGDEAILDIGCGFGDLIIRLKKEGHRGKLTGIDISEGMIKEAKENSKGLDIQFGVSNAEELPFKKETFDLIICKHSLYHFELKKAIREIERCLKPEGILIFTLNSYSQKSRYYSEKYKSLISKELDNFNFLDTGNNLNFESYHKYFKGFHILKEVKIHRYIILEESTPFVEYMSTFKEHWDPIPSQRAWEEALGVVRKDIDNIIKKDGKFEEKASFGIAVLEKF